MWIHPLTELQNTWNKNLKWKEKWTRGLWGRGRTAGKRDHSVGRPHDSTGTEAVVSGGGRNISEVIQEAASPRCCLHSGDSLILWMSHLMPSWHPPISWDLLHSQACRHYACNRWTFGPFTGSLGMSKDDVLSSLHPGTADSWQTNPLLPCPSVAHLGAIAYTSLEAPMGVKLQLPTLASCSLIP